MLVAITKDGCETNGLSLNASNTKVLVFERNGCGKTELYLSKIIIRSL